jgi:hypothetical protein
MKLEDTERLIRDGITNVFHTLPEDDTALRGYDEISGLLERVCVGF